MKIRISFVTNSSSTAYIIVNKTKKKKTLMDFVLENPKLIDHYLMKYDWEKSDMVNLGAMIESANARNQKAQFLDENPGLMRVDYSQLESGGILHPGDNYCRFGDEQGDLIGRVYDYILRDGGESKSFKWKYRKSLR